MARLVWLLLAFLIASPGARAATTDAAPRARNVVQRIEVTTEPAAVLVTIVLRSPPTFTTRTVASRREFIVDLPEARFERPVPVTPIQNGVLAQVESSVVLREGVPMARVTLVMAADGEPPLVDAQGSALRVRIPGTPSPPLLAGAPSPSEQPAVVAATPPVPATAPVPASAPVLATAPDPAIAPSQTPVAARADPQPAPAPPRESAPVATKPPPAATRPVAAVAAVHPASAPAPSPQRLVARPVPEPRRLVREVAFRPLPTSSAVVVRLSGPPRFEVIDVDERRVSVELPNTTIERRNDSRPLDTSYFPGAVATIISRRAGSTTRIDIHLKRRTAHRERVEGDALVIEIDH